MSDIRTEVEAVLSRLPDETGGIAIVLATSGAPPAMALLSTGDVYLSGDQARVGIHASSSAVSRLGESFTLLVPLGETAARIEVGAATAVEVPPLALISGQVRSIRPTAEPPWTLAMAFRPEPPDHRSIPAYVIYWKGVRAWLAGERAQPPEIPRA